MTLLERTKEVAKLRGISLTDLALKAGLAEKSIYSWDRSTPKADNLAKVADVLNVTTDYLLGNSIRMHDTESNTVDLAAEGVFLYQGQEVTDEQMEIIRSMMESWQD